MKGLRSSGCKIRQPNCRDRDLVGQMPYRKYASSKSGKWMTKRGGVSRAQLLELTGASTFQMVVEQKVVLCSDCRCEEAKHACES